MSNYLTDVFYGALNPAEFNKAWRQAMTHLIPAGIFAGDSLITIQKNLGFLDDKAFMNAFENNITNESPHLRAIEQALIWRVHVLSWAAYSSLRLDGDFMECACYKGTSAKIICDYLGFNQTGKHYYLYDLFEHEQGMDHHAMPEHGISLHDRVRQRFADYPNVHVLKGSVPEVLHAESPEKIAFMHLDINSVTAEIGALELMFDRIVPGGMLVLDDYGWLGYRDQKQAEDKFFAERGYRVLELPTGQGLLIK